jgi:N-acetylmuramoyl-L-alanine amidase
MLRKLFNFLKQLFSKTENAETGVIDSGETTTIDVVDVVDDMESGETISAATSVDVSGQTDGLDSAESVESGYVSHFKILVDNGHGVETPGKRSPWSAHKVKPEIEFFEYKWNREIAKPIVEELRKRGYDAELIVTEERDISLTERANRVNKICKEVGTNNVILLSVHANAAGRGDKWMTARGWCAFTTKGKTKSDEFAEFLYDEAEKNFKGHTIRKDKSDGDRDWEANFTIIFKSVCPAVLTENFFYDNVDDVNYILSEEGRAAVIKTHVDGIINYIKHVEDERRKQGYHQA